MTEEAGERSAVVVVVGSVNADVVVTTDRLPGPGETVTGGTLARHWGGKGANQAVAAARYGVVVRFVGAVGDDAAGEGSRAALERAGVDTAHLATQPGTPTGIALIVVDAEGENQIAVAPGANGLVDAAGLPDVLRDLPRPGVLLTGLEIPDEAVAATLATGRRLGWRVVLDPAPARDLGEMLVGSGALLTPNRSELPVIARSAAVPDDDEEAAARGLSRVTGAPVIVTRGAAGALVAREEGTWSLEPPRVEVRDATGAGDAFAGVLAAALAERRSLRAAVRLAVVAGALSTRTAGARDGMPTGAALREVVEPDARL